MPEASRWIFLSVLQAVSVCSMNRYCFVHYIKSDYMFQFSLFHFSSEACIILKYIAVFSTGEKQTAINNKLRKIKENINTMKN